MTRLRAVFAAVLLAAATLLAVPSAAPALVRAADEVSFGKPDAVADYGNSIAFTVDVTRSVPLDRVELRLRFPDTIGPLIVDVPVPPGVGTSTLRYELENARIETWLSRLCVLAAINPQLALEAARCQRLVKGYSDTHARGLRNFETLMSVVDRHRRSLAPTTLKELRDAALADEHGHRLNDCLNRLALTA